MNSDVAFAIWLVVAFIAALGLGHLGDLAVSRAVQSIRRLAISRRARRAALRREQFMRVWRIHEQDRQEALHR